MRAVEQQASLALLVGAPGECRRFSHNAIRDATDLGGTPVSIGWGRWAAVWLCLVVAVPGCGDRGDDGGLETGYDEGDVTYAGDEPGDETGGEVTPRPSNGEVGEACMPGGTCAANLLCIGDVCTDLGAVDTPGLEGDESSVEIYAGFYLIGEEGIGLTELEADGTLELEPLGAEPLPEFLPGDVIAAWPDDGDFFLAVVDVTEWDDGTTTVTTRPPLIDEAFANATLRLDSPVDWSLGELAGDGAAVATVIGGAKRDSPEQAKPSVLELKVGELPAYTFEGELKHEGVGAGVTAEVGIGFKSGTVRLEAAGTYDLDISLSDGVRGYVGIDVTATQDYVAELQVKAEGKGEFELPPFLKVPLRVRFAIPAGIFVIPVWVDLNLEVALGGEVSVSGEATLTQTVKKTETMVVGGRLEGGVWKPYETHTKPEGGSSMTTEGGVTVEAVAGVKLTSEALLYGLGGPKFEVFAGLKGAAEVQTNAEGAQVGTEEVAAKVEAKVELKLPELYGFETPEFKETLLDYSHLLSSASFCVPNCSGGACGSGGCPTETFPDKATICGICDGEPDAGSETGGSEPDVTPDAGPTEPDTGGPGPDLEPGDLVDQGDGTVKDGSTGLIWSTQVMDTGKITLAEHEQACAALGAGFRLPTYPELRTLVRGCPAMESGGCWIATDCDTCQYDGADGDEYCGPVDTPACDATYPYEACEECEFGAGPGPGSCYWPDDFAMPEGEDCPDVISSAVPSGCSNEGGEIDECHMGIDFSEARHIGYTGIDGRICVK